MSDLLLRLFDSSVVTVGLGFALTAALALLLRLVM
jgi:hypothetical protein